MTVSTVLAVVQVRGALAQSIRFTESGASAHLANPTFSSHGVSVIDYDNDGWDDVFIAGWYNTALYHNNHDGTFTNVTAQAGLLMPNTRCCVGIWADLNNDGWPDLFVGARDSVGTSKVFLNNGDGTFRNVTVGSGIDSVVSVATAAFGDFDNDGKVDLFVATRNAPDRLYRNVSTAGVIRFQDVTAFAGVGGDPSTSAMQATWVDYNHDGFADLFAVADGSALSRLYRNTSTSQFVNVAGQAHIDSVGRGNSMGTSWGDFNNDGWEDAYVSRIDSGGLYRNNGNGTFTEVAAAVGADSNGMSWGVVWSDFDNDGNEDLFIANISSYGGKHPASMLYRNINGRFSDIAGPAGAAFLMDAYGVATGDFNNDGYEDIVIADYGFGQNKLLINQRASPGHWLKVRLTGVSVNRMAIGSSIRVVAGGRSQVRVVTAGSSYASQISPTLHVGLANALVIDTLEVRWSKGNVQQFRGLAVDKTYSLTEGSPQSVLSVPTLETGAVSTSLGQNYPNPFNPVTTIPFSISANGKVRLTVYDLLGRAVRTIVDGIRTSGEHWASFDGTNLPSGIYFYSLECGGHVLTRALILLK